MTTYRQIIKKYLVHTVKNNVRAIGGNGRRYTTLSKRIILNRRGYSVHSPFVYSFIHNTIKNNRAYYSYSILREETQIIRGEIEEDKNSNSIYRVSLLELIFRISNSIDLNKVIIVSNSISAVPYYLRTEKHNKVIQVSSKEYVSSKDKAIVIFEDIDEEAINKLSNNIKDQNNKSIFIISTRNKYIKEQIIDIANQNKHEYASIELNNLDIWFLDRNISPKRAKVYYK